MPGKLVAATNLEVCFMVGRFKKLKNRSMWLEGRELGYIGEMGL